MYKRYIDPIELKMSIVLNTDKTLEEIIDDEPAAEVVSKGLFDQIKWERDVAIAQLEELGIGFGQKFGCEYCRYKRTSYRNMWCEIFDKIMPEDGYCCLFEFAT